MLSDGSMAIRMRRTTSLEGSGLKSCYGVGRQAVVRVEEFTLDLLGFGHIVNPPCAVTALTANVTSSCGFRWALAGWRH
jgi:hypothetical protein